MFCEIVTIEVHIFFLVTISIYRIVLFVISLGYSAILKVMSRNFIPNHIMVAVYYPESNSDRYLEMTAFQKGS